MGMDISGKLLRLKTSFPPNCGCHKLGLYQAHGLASTSNWWIYKKLVNSTSAFLRGCDETKSVPWTCFDTSDAPHCSADSSPPPTEESPNALLRHRRRTAWKNSYIFAEMRIWFPENCRIQIFIFREKDGGQTPNEIHCLHKPAFPAVQLMLDSSQMWTMDGGGGQPGQVRSAAPQTVASPSPICGAARRRRRSR
jgi:hypothetical protein